jgi:hypothetical protein
MQPTARDPASLRADYGSHGGFRGRVSGERKTGKTVSKAEGILLRRLTSHGQPVPKVLCLMIHGFSSVLFDKPATFAYIR